MNSENYFTTFAKDVLMTDKKGNFGGYLIKTVKMVKILRGYQLARHFP